MESFEDIRISYGDWFHLWKAFGVQKWRNLCRIKCSQARQVKYGLQSDWCCDKESCLREKGNVGFLFTAHAFLEGNPRCESSVRRDGESSQKKTIFTLVCAVQLLWPLLVHLLDKSKPQKVWQPIPRVGWTPIILVGYVPNWDFGNQQAHYLSWLGSVAYELDCNIFSTLLH